MNELARKVEHFSFGVYPNIPGSNHREFKTRLIVMIDGFV